MLDGTGELVIAVADMAVFDAWPDVSTNALQSDLLLMDTNVPASVIEQASRSCKEFWVEPVSIAKSARISECMDKIGLASPNLDELRAMVESIGSAWSPVDATSLASLERTLPAAVEPVLRKGVRHLLVTCGAMGAVLCSAAPSTSKAVAKEEFAFADPDFKVVRQHWNLPQTKRTFVYYSVPRLDVVESVTGAGDSLIAGTAWAFGIAKAPLADAVLYGLAAARLCLGCKDNVSPLLAPDRITPRPASSRL